MPALASDLRRQLEHVIIQARDVAEAAARAALKRLAVDAARPFDHFSEAQKQWRNRLRARARQAGDQRQPNGEQEIDQLTQELAYEYWHRMLFARFLTENNLLMHPDGVVVSLADCEDLAQMEGAENGWVLVARYASRMLPQIFRTDDVLLEIEFPINDRLPLEKLLASLPTQTFTANDSLGWVYQYWQSKKKEEVNRSGAKIDGRTLPAVTQLFTEPYMVKFLLHNTIGAWWCAQHGIIGPSGGAGVPAGQAPTAMDYLRWRDDGAPAAGSFDGWPKTLKEFTMLDPCCGSGHFLVEAFHMVVPLRMHDEGLSAKEACDAVLAENLFGLELDPRCTQIAAFALALAAWKYPDELGQPLGSRPLPPLNIACSGQSVTGKKEEWLALANGDGRLIEGMDKLYDLFGQAPLLGSLIDPYREVGDLIVAGFAELEPLLARALAREKVQQDADASAVGIAAQGITKAAELLARRYTLIATNVPYLARGKHSHVLSEFIDANYEAAKADLATVFVERSLNFCEANGTISSRFAHFLDQFQTLPYNSLIFGTLVQPDSHSPARGWVHGAEQAKSRRTVNFQKLCDFISLSNVENPPKNERTVSISLVTPQNWLFLKSYRKLRENLLNIVTWNMVVKLGPAAFREMNWWAATTILKVATRRKPFEESRLVGLDVSTTRITAQKGFLLRTSKILEARQSTQLKNPDARIMFIENKESNFLSEFANVFTGIQTGDNPKYIRRFYELDDYGKSWSFQLRTVDKSALLGGREQVLFWENGRGALVNDPQARINSVHAALGGRGLCVNRTASLATTLYNGELFDQNGAVIIPKDPRHLASLWYFLSSDEFRTAVRQLDSKTGVTPATLIKVPFDLARWMKIAQESSPLSEPISCDPTQWLFKGDIAASTDPFQASVARLLGYRWPEQPKEQDALHALADTDGIVCIPSVRQEQPAAERLLDILRAAYGPLWSGAILNKLLAGAGCRPDMSLDDWLRDKFFEQHCKCFHHRPFIWHIWDGRKDGFACLVNYHKVNHQRLETLAYAYLQDWITAQAAAAREGKLGADLRLAVAQELQNKLKLILEGEPPYDIFVRWKPIHEQPIGWNPDLNDGVRVNIRPFVMANVLRKPPSITWTKDRGKEPQRDPEQFPWFWKNGAFTGDRINDVHLTIAQKRAVREKAGHG